MSEHEKNADAVWEALKQSGDEAAGAAFDALLAEHRAEVRALEADRANLEWRVKNLTAARDEARDAALEEAAQAIDRRRMSGGGVIEQEGLDELANAACITRDLQSAPASVVRHSSEAVETAMHEAGLGERDRMAVHVLLHTPLTPPLMVPVEKVREVLSEVERISRRETSALKNGSRELYAFWQTVKWALKEVRMRLGVDLDAAGGEVMPTGHVNCGPSCPGWTGETASVGNGLLPAPRKSHVYDEPAQPPKSSGECKGCDAPEDAPPDKHRFSCSVHGKRRARTTADVSPRRGTKKP